MDVYRIMYRFGPDSEWRQHTGGSSNSNGFYTLSGAKVAISHLTSRGYNRGHEYRIERSALYWVEVG